MPQKLSCLCQMITKSMTSSSMISKCRMRQQSQPFERHRSLQRILLVPIWVHLSLPEYSRIIIRHHLIVLREHTLSRCKTDDCIRTSHGLQLNLQPTVPKMMLCLRVAICRHGKEASPKCRSRICLERYQGIILNVYPCVRTIRHRLVVQGTLVMPNSMTLKIETRRPRGRSRSLIQQVVLHPEALLVAACQHQPGLLPIPPSGQKHLRLLSAQQSSRSNMTTPGVNQYTVDAHGII